MRALLLALVVAGLGTARLVAQDTAQPPPSSWPHELGEALDLYYAGEFIEVQRLCRLLSSGTQGTRLRRETAALAALATMRQPGRSNRLAGCARLRQLTEEDSSLLARPECQLAYGIAQTALNNTSAALAHLSQAADTFADRGQSASLAETCVALAEAWARHQEWEIPVPEVQQIRRPDNQAEADRIRRNHIRELRQRLADLPGCEDHAARVDLTLAQHLIESPDGAVDGLSLLEGLAGRKQLTITTADACLALGRHYEALERWTEAARLYMRVQAGNLGERSHEARQLHQAIERPQLALNVSGQVAVGQRVAVDLQARNLAAVEFEVRRVDLADWLQRRQGRFVEAALPTSGALVAAGSLETTATPKHAWWRAETLEQPLAFDAPAGAVVVLARATDDAGRRQTSKRLVLAGDLNATAFISPQRAVIWVTHRSPAESTAGETDLQARFWMHGSFVPTRPRFTDGVAAFSLPPEAHLLRDKRWVCLVRSGEQVTLCRGTLAGGGEQRGAPAVALIGGPPTPRAGDHLHLFGMLLGESSEYITKQAPRSVELELLDALDRVVNTTTAEISEAHTFSARVPITEAMAGKHLHVAVRLGEQILEQVYSRSSVRVAPIDQSPLRVSFTLPTWLPATNDRVAGQVEIAYPWGIAVSGDVANARIRAARLPTAQPRRGAAFSLVHDSHLDLDIRGRADLVQPTAVFRLPDGPLAIGIQVEAVGWDDRRVQASAEVLLGPEPIHFWLDCENDPPRVGEPLHTTVGWFDPSGRAAGQRPTLAVWHDGRVLSPLPLHPALGGLGSRTWRPTAPGSYELVATLPLNESDSVVVRESIDVQARGTAGQPDQAPLRYEARVVRREGRPYVHVKLNGQRHHPLLVLLEAGDPLVAQQLPSIDGTADLFLPLAEPHRSDVRAILAAPGPGGIQILGVVAVQPADEQALTVVLTPPAEAPAPGSAIEIGATASRMQQRARDATITARLVDLTRSGGVQWASGDSRSDLMLLPGGLQVTDSADALTNVPGEAPDLIPETRELPADLAQALFEGSTAWIDSRSNDDGAATFVVPLPPQPSLYRLVVTACAPGGAFACQTVDLDTRHAPRLSADVPPELTLGDRSVSSLIIANNESTAARARVTFDAGPGLHTDGLRLLDRQAQSETGGDRTSLTLTLAPHGVQTLHAGVEAAQPVAGTVSFVVEARRGRQRASAPYRVHARAAAPESSKETSPERIVVQRTLFLLEKDQIVTHDEHAIAAGLSHPGQTEWLRLEVRPGERIPPGRQLLVQEEFYLSQPLIQVEWRQRLPGNCYTHAGQWSDLRRIGTQRDLRLESLANRAARLDAGQRHIHEYVIVPVRPGACWFPAPTVRADGRQVSVEIVPDFQTLVVSNRD